MDLVYKRIAELEATIEQLHRRINNMFREAKVTEVFDNGTASVIAHGGEMKAVPWLERSGSIGDWVPPEQDERVLLISPGGNMGRGLILPGGYSDKYPQPHNKLGEARRKVGSSVDTTTKKERRIEAEDIFLVGRVHINGELVEHNGKNIGDDHKHKGVTPGSGNTDVPV